MCYAAAVAIGTAAAIFKKIKDFEDSNDNKDSKRWMKF